MARPIKPTAGRYAELAQQLGLPTGEVRLAFGEPPKIAAWFKKVLLCSTCDQLWDMLDDFWKGESPRSQRIVLLRILYHTRRMATRWRVYETAFQMHMEDVAESAIDEIVRLAKTQADFVEIIRRADKKHVRARRAAIRDYAAAMGRHRASQRYGLGRKHPHPLMILERQAG